MEDPAEVGNNLLRSMLLKMENSSSTVNYYNDAFVPSPRAIRVNCFFMISLSCSVFTSLGAVLGKQWLAHYNYERHALPPAERGRERHRKYMGAQNWHLKAVIETLPTLLQLSLFLFLIALVDLFWPLNRTVASTVIAFTLLTFTFYIGTTTIAVLAFGSPFQTRFSALLFRLKAYITGYHEREDPYDTMGARCVNWLLETTTLPEAVAEAVKAVLRLSYGARDKLNLDAARVVKLLMKPVIIGGSVQWGISIDSLRSASPDLLNLVGEEYDFNWTSILPSLPQSKPSPFHTLRNFLRQAGSSSEEDSSEDEDLNQQPSALIHHSIRDAAMQMMLSSPSPATVEAYRPIFLLLGTIEYQDAHSIEQFDPIYRLLVHNLRSSPSPNQSYHHPYHHL